jgi:spore coat polysaccharide biosynthesis protein SpsF
MESHEEISKYGRELSRMSGFVTPKPFIAIVVQARLGGSRFPGKVMYKLGEHPVLWWVLMRCAQSRLKHAVVVATPDKRISDYANSLGCWSYWDRGHDPNDLIGRYVRAARYAGADTIVRITSDCPLIDPHIIDMAISEISYFDMVSTVLARNQQKRRTPKGLEVEVVTLEALQKLDAKVTDKRQREHVLPYIYENPDEFYIKDLEYPPDDPRIDWCIDDRDGLDRLNFYLRGCISEAVNMNYKELLSEPLATFNRTRSVAGSDSENHEPGATEKAQ